LAVTLKDNARPTIEECERRLTSICPRSVTGVEVEDIIAKGCKVEAGYESFSTPLLVSLPVLKSDFSLLEGEAQT